MREVLRRALASPCCRAEVRVDDAAFVCEACERTFRGSGNSVCFRYRETSSAEKEYRVGLRGWLRARVASSMLRFFSPVLITGPSWVRWFAGELDRGELVLDVGSGNTRGHRHVTTVDVVAYPFVDLVADADHLPLRDASAHGIVSVALLEHVQCVEPVLREWQRVLAPGGRVFVVVPFLQPFHAAPGDYRRWTSPGLRSLVGEYFDVRTTGVYCGPTSALTWILAEWIAVVLSFGVPRLQTAWSYGLQVILSPLKWLDTLAARLPGADRLASALYVVAERRNGAGSTLDPGPPSTRSSGEIESAPRGPAGRQ